MDDETFEQEVIFWDKIENIRPWLLEDTIYTLVLYNGNVIAVEPPIFMELTITETVPGVRGDTASGRVLKPAVTNTGAKVMVPIFIDEGEVVRIDTRTGSYDSRVSK